MEKKDLIVICGPTASGKTSLAVKIAEMLSSGKNEPAAEIISADSRQVYRGMNIGTGKDLSEYSTEKISVPYHCIDIRNPDENFTLHDYMAEFGKALETVRKNGNIPLLAGGTGLYIESVIRNYRLDNVPPDQNLRRELEKLDRDELSEKLKKADRGIYLRTDLSSRKRIIRGIEKAVFLKKKRPDGTDLKILHDENSQAEAVRNPLVLATRWKREELVSRIEKRLDERLEEGMVEEVRALMAEGITSERLFYLGLEYRYISEYLIGRLSWVEMRGKLFTEIRRFSKRQATYFRGMERRGTEVFHIDRAEAGRAMEIILQHEY